MGDNALINSWGLEVQHMRQQIGDTCFGLLSKARILRVFMLAFQKFAMGMWRVLQLVGGSEELWTGNRNG